MQSELDKGVSLDEIKKKITKGEIQTKVSKQLKTKKYFRVERIQRKKRDLMQLLNKYPVKSEEKIKIPAEPKALTTIELFANAVEEQDGSSVLNKKIYKLAGKELLVRKDGFFCWSSAALLVYFFAINILILCITIFQGPCY